MAQLLLASLRGRGIWFLLFLWRQQKRGRRVGSRGRQREREGGKQRRREEMRQRGSLTRKTESQAEIKKRKKEDGQTQEQGRGRVFSFISSTLFSISTKVATFPKLSRFFRNFFQVTLFYFI